MRKVSFVSNGKRVEFEAKPKKKRPDDALTPYQLHVRKEFAKAKRASGGVLSKEQAQRVMRAAAKAWKAR